MFGAPIRTPFHQPGLSDRHPLRLLFPSLPCSMNVGAILQQFFSFVKGFFEKVRHPRRNVRPAKTDSGQRLRTAMRQIGNLATSQKCLGSPYGGAVTAIAVTERALLSPLRGHLSHRERQGRLRRQLCKYQFSLLRKVKLIRGSLNIQQLQDLLAPVCQADAAPDGVSFIPGRILLHGNIVVQGYKALALQA